MKPAARCARVGLAVAALLVVLAGCHSAERSDSPPSNVIRPEWALAIHGGAGVISRSVDDQNRDEYLASLRAALTMGQEVLDRGGSSLDAVVKVLVFFEDDPKFNAGRGAVYNHQGGHELDASIMDGSNLACGAVANVSTVRNPIVLARHVMEDTRHVLLAGSGAEQFADEVGLQRVPQSYFHTERRRRQWQESIQKRQDAAAGKGEGGTAGVVALDRRGNLAAGTTTGGLTDKRFGRIGDSPIIGAGTYADNATCAVSATGQGEEFIRHNVAHRISALMAYGGMSLQAAAEEVILHTLKPGDGGVIAIDRDGAIAMVYNSEGMFRGAADARGRFEVAIWE